MGHLERTGIRVICAALVLAVVAVGIKPLATMAIDSGGIFAFVAWIAVLFAIGFAVDRRDRQRPPPL